MQTTSIPDTSHPVSEVFSWPRFAAFFRAHTRVNRQQLLSGCLITFIALFITFCIGQVLDKWRIYSFHADTEIDPMWMNMTMKALFLFFFFMSLGASFMFSSMSKKSSRISTLVLPASSFEKFLTFFLIYIVGAVIVFGVSVFMADLLRVGWIKLFTSYGDQAALCPWNYWFFQTLEPDASGYCTSALILSAAMTIQALFALGSIIWKKLPFIKTSGALFVIFMAISLSATWLVSVLYPFGWTDAWLDPDPSVSLAWKILTSGIVTALLIYWLIFVRFREDEIIDRW